MSTTSPTTGAALPDWADKLYLEDREKADLTIVLDDTKKVSERIAAALRVKEAILPHIEEVEGIIAEGEEYLSEARTMLQEFKTPAAEIESRLAVIRSQRDDDLQEAHGPVVSFMQEVGKLQSLPAEDSRSKRDAEGLDEKKTAFIVGKIDADPFFKLAPDDTVERGEKIMAYIKDRYADLKKSGAPIDAAAVAALIENVTNDVSGAAKVIPEKIRTKTKLKFKLANYIRLLLLTEADSRDVANVTPDMLPGVVNRIPEDAGRAEIFKDYKALTKLPGGSSVLVTVGGIRRSYYNESGTEAEIHPDVAAACSGSAPMRITRVEYVTNEDVKTLLAGISKGDKVEATVRAGASKYAGKTVMISGLNEGDDFVVSIDGEDKEAGEAFMKELKVAPMKWLEHNYKVEFGTNA